MFPKPGAVEAKRHAVSEFSLKSSLNRRKHLVFPPSATRATLASACLSRLPVTDQISILKLATKRLDAVGIASMLAGSIAMGFYAQPRV